MNKSPLAGLMRREMTRKEFLQWLGVLVAILFGIDGVIRILRTHAATPGMAAEAEDGALTSPATAVSDSTASGGKAVQFGAVSTSTPPPTTSGNIYRPISVTDPKQLPHAPASANYVNWNTLGVTYLDQAFAKLGANDILVLPERSAPYEIDSSHGFMRDSGHWYSMARAKRGLVGLGPGVIVQPSASTYHSGRIGFGGGGNQNRMLECYTDGGYFANFEMRGRDFGGVQYDATSQGGNDAVWERIYFNGAHRGFQNYPDGETGGVSSNRGARVCAYNCEVDCRDPATGARVGTSPLMFNNQSNVTVVDVYAHHAVAGMPTFWQVNNAATTRLRSEHNGSGGGGLNGSGINHERVTGTITHDSPTLLIDYVSQGGKNTGLHLSIDTINATYTVINPIFDAGPAGPGVFTIQTSSNTGNTSLVHIKNAAGGAVPFRIYS